MWAKPRRSIHYIQRSNSTTSAVRRAGTEPAKRLAPPIRIRITEQQDEHAIQIFTDGSKSENGVGAEMAVFIQS
jgi:hypothetical protein